MFTCPQCGVKLEQQHDRNGIFWRCPSCNGRALNVSVLRKTVLRDAVNELWLQAREGGGAPGHTCPSCEGRMQLVRSSAATTPMQVDVCPACMLLWFDAGEHEALPLTPQTSLEEPELPPEAREALAMVKVAAIAERYSGVDDAGEPAEEWKCIPGYLGLPVEADAPAVQSVPLVTWLLVAIVSLISAYVLSSANWAIEEFGMVPAQAWRHGGITFLTVFFLHGSWAHLLSNMYFLFIFGDNAEDYLGKWRFLLLLAASTIAGNIAHLFGDPRSTMPCIGASGGIAGVMACYALAYPNSRIAFIRFYRWIAMPAWGVMLLWVGMQLIGAWQQIQGFTNVSALAHLGGAATGLACWLFWRKGAPRNGPVARSGEDCQ